MGPAHTNWELKPRKRRNTTRLQHLFLNKPPPPPKNAVWKVLVTARGGSTPRNQKGILLLSAWCFPLGCSGKGFANGKAGVKSPENLACLQIQYILPRGLPASVLWEARTQSRIPGWNTDSKWILVPSPMQVPKCSLQEEVARPDPAWVLRQSLPRWLLGEVRGF